MIINQSGFTLVELLITISILVIISAITIPSFGNFSDNSVLQQQALNVTNDIELVKNKALSGAYANNVGDSANWGIIFCPGGSLNNTQYTLNAFNNTTSAWESVTKTLTNDVTFNCSAQTNWVFERLTGLPVLPAADDSMTMQKAGFSGTKTILIDHVSGRLTFN